ncbi:MAG: B12-binding domain-containing radical SAM protein [Candidatus Omnitrophota bacterium]
MEKKLALVQCPMWDIEFPPYNIALICAVLKGKRFEAECFDFNRSFHDLLPQEQYLWNISNPYGFWQSQKEVLSFLGRNKNIIEGAISSLEKFEILGFTLQSLNFVFAVELIKKIKERYPEKIILAGGPECFINFSPEYLMSTGMFDAVCLREAEIVLPELLRKISNNEDWRTEGFLIKTGDGPLDCGQKELVRCLDELPFADFGFLNEQTEKISISTSRGCIAHCSFCIEKSHWSPHRFRSAVSVVEEIAFQKSRFSKLKFVYLNDSLINGNMEGFSMFCDLMAVREMGVNWGGHILVRKEMTKGFLLKMKIAGAERLNFGIESGSDSVLKIMKKSFDTDLALRTLEYTKDAGISFSVNLVIGHPGESEEDFEKTRRFVNKIRALTDCIHINPCYVLKGSDLFENHKKWGMVLPEDYVTNWFLADGSNDSHIRSARVNALLGNCSYRS